MPKRSCRNCNREMFVGAREIVYYPVCDACKEAAREQHSVHHPDVKLPSVVDELRAELEEAKRDLAAAKASNAAMREALSSLVRLCEDAPHTDGCPYDCNDAVPEDALCLCWQTDAIDASGALAALAERKL